MAMPAEDVVLYSIIAFIVVENVIEIYLSMRQVSEKKKQPQIFTEKRVSQKH